MPVKRKKKNAQSRTKKIIIDTREKDPLPITNTISKKLDYGDYSLEGKEDELAVERKSAADFYSSISKANFWKELHMMGKMKKAYLLLELSEVDIINFPSTLPLKFRKKLRVKPPYVLSMIPYIKNNYNIKVILAGDRFQAAEHLKKILV